MNYVAEVASLTQHPVGDAVLPAAQRLVGAVRDGDHHGITQAIADARTAAHHPYWVTALLCVVAAMVSDEEQPSELLAWNRPGT